MLLEWYRDKVLNQIQKSRVVSWRKHDAKYRINLQKQIWAQFSNFFFNAEYFRNNGK